MPDLTKTFLSSTVDIDELEQSCAAANEAEDEIAISRDMWLRGSKLRENLQHEISLPTGAYEDWSSYYRVYNNKAAADILAGLNKGAQSLFRFLASEMLYYNWAFYSPQEISLVLSFHEKSLSRFLKELQNAGAVLKMKTPTAFERDLAEFYLERKLSPKTKAVWINPDLAWRGAVKWRLVPADGHLIKNRSDDWQTLVDYLGWPGLEAGIADCTLHGKYQHSLAEKALQKNWRVWGLKASVAQQK